MALSVTFVFSLLLLDMEKLFSKGREKKKKEEKALTPDMKDKRLFLKMKENTDVVW